MIPTFYGNMDSLESVHKAGAHFIKTLQTTKVSIVGSIVIECVPEPPSFRSLTDFSLISNNIIYANMVEHEKW